jgi:hypothetical protein
LKEPVEDYHIWTKVEDGVAKEFSSGTEGQPYTATYPGKLKLIAQLS